MKSVFAIGALCTVIGACTSGAKVKSEQPYDEGKFAALEKRVEDIDGRLQRIEDLLRDMLESNANQPDPQAVYSVPIDGFPTVGPDNAPITIVKAYEFACGYCYRVRETLDQVMAAYPGKIKLVYKPFIVHADVAVAPAMGVCAADKQGKFVEMTNLVWEKAFVKRDLGEERIAALAGEVGLDMSRYKTDIRSSACLERLQRSVENLSNLGVSGTPTFFVNGRMLIGAQPLPAFTELIDDEMAKVEKAIAAGTSAQEYYRKVVLEGGQKSL